MIATAELGGWIAGGVGITVAIVAAISQTRQVHIATQPVAQRVAADLYQGLFSDLQAEVARLHDDVKASRAAEAECREVVVELRRRVAALETTIEGMQP